MVSTRKDPQRLLEYGRLYRRGALLDQGLSAHWLDNQLKNGSIVAVIPGIYMRPGSPLQWQNLVASLPQLLNEPVLLGGQSSLELQGYAHYLSSMAQRSLDIFSPAARPAWLRKINIWFENVDFEWVRTGHLWNEGWPKPDFQQIITENIEFGVPVSQPEQAILELLLGVPDKISFDKALRIMEGLTHLSPRKLGTLLQQCKSIKVKRLFFWLADQLDYPWRHQLKPADYNMGNGKRVIEKGGKLDRNYLITVPSYMNGEP